MSNKSFMFADKKNKVDNNSATLEKTPWKVLVVDDDTSIHTVTELVLDDFTYNNKKLHILNAYSAEEAKTILQQNNDIAMAFLDVVMESDTAGLELVHYIRNKLKNHNIRIVLRTGQPGVAPESEVITTYDIDDYKDKTELTNIKLKTTVHNALKAYEHIMQLKDNATQLEKYKNMFDSATDFIFIVNDKHNIVEANKAFLHAIGKTHAEVINKPIFDIFYDNLHNKDIEKNIQKSMSGQNITYESEMEFTALGRRFVDIEFFPYYDKGNELSAAVVNLKDITTDVTQREEVNALKTVQIDNYEQTIISLVDAIEQRDSFTAGHTRRVANYSKKIAQAMDISAEDIELLYKAAMLHDIGKISTPDAILLKPGQFNNFEYELIKDHLEVGYELLNKVDMYKELAEIMRYHHERYDGKGYPHGFKGDEIPLLGYILGTADSFDAMTTNRIYKRRKEVDTALEEMVSLKGKQFHPDVVDAAFIALKNSNIELGNQLPTTKMEKARFSYFFKDHLTKVYNKDYLKIELALHKDEYKSMHFLQLHNMTQFNKENSWESGDTLLCAVAQYLHDNFTHCPIFRVYGDDFLILCRDEKEFNLEKLHQQSFLHETCVNASYKFTNISAINDLRVDNFEQYLR